MALFFLHGASEVMDKYAEFLYDIRQLQPGYDIYFMEHRGMGSSGRLISESKYLYVDDFDNYVRDAKTFYDTVISANNAYFKVFIWAHSLGAAVATSYAQKYRNDIQGLVISSPMMEILTKFPLSLDEDVAYTTTCASTLIGQGEQLALGQELPDTLVDPTSKESWERETVTTSWKRWTVFQELLVNNQATWSWRWWWCHFVGFYQWLCQRSLFCNLFHSQKKECKTNHCTDLNVPSG
ncbi:lysophospholipase l2 [Seminavis robusta]|uniref:Lysophospholipase l2 n=1 Tax=Seminavis robusta TaxID=568900 RepID=A0A9N8ENA7_9STRA|nr:lysophospholipase l2 [Seminavis robusta]|eukprot:Sro1218_g253350.1 lysophospholipase l2 (238) ;mRNA; r:21072-21785